MERLREHVRQFGLVHNHIFIKQSAKNTMAWFSRWRSRVAGF